MKIIEPLWLGFAAKMCPPGTPELEVRKMQHSFYAGSSVLFSVLTKKIDDPTVSSEEGAKFMGEITAEIVQFADSISPRPA